MDGGRGVQSGDMDPLPAAPAVCAQDAPKDQVHAHGDPHAGQPQFAVEHQDGRQDDTHTPHADEPHYHGIAHVMGPPQIAGEHDGQSEEGFGKADDAQHQGGLLHHLGIRVEEGGKRRGEEEEKDGQRGTERQGHPG